MNDAHRPARGLCPVCLGEYQTTQVGVVRVHGAYLPKWDADLRKRDVCPGSGRPPLKLEESAKC